MGLAVKQKAYIKGNKNFLGTITLESGEQFNFVSGQRFLYLMFPFLQWVMPVYCWKKSDDANQDINFNIPLAILIVCLIPLTRNWGVGFPIPFHIPLVLSFGISITVGIMFVEYLERKFKVPRNVTLYKIRIHPGIVGICVLLVNVVASLPEVVAIWATLTMPRDLLGPYMLLVCMPFYSCMGNILALGLRKCSVEFLGKVKN